MSALRPNQGERGSYRQLWRKSIPAEGAVRDCQQTQLWCEPGPPRGPRARVGGAGGGGREELGVWSGEGSTGSTDLGGNRARHCSGRPYLSPAAAKMNYHNHHDFQQHKLILYFPKSGMGLGGRNQGVSGTVFLLGALGENQTLICRFSAP